MNEEWERSAFDDEEIQEESKVAQRRLSDVALDSQETDEQKNEQLIRQLLVQDEEAKMQNYQALVDAQVEHERKKQERIKKVQQDAAASLKELQALAMTNQRQVPAPIAPVIVKKEQPVVRKEESVNEFDRWMDKLKVNIDKTNKKIVAGFDDMLNKIDGIGETAEQKPLVVANVDAEDEDIKAAIAASLMDQPKPLVNIKQKEAKQPFKQSDMNQYDEFCFEPGTQDQPKLFNPYIRILKEEQKDKRNDQILVEDYNRGMQEVKKPEAKKKDGISEFFGNLDSAFSKLRI